MYIYIYIYIHTIFNNMYIQLFSNFRSTKVEKSGNRSKGIFKIKKLARKIEKFTKKLFKT